MIEQPPAELTAGLSDAERSSVAKWWGRLLPHQRQAVQLVLADPECTLQFSDPRVLQPSAAAEFFDDDWETNWADNWETDWREYLTEHPDVRLVTLEFISCVIRHR